MVKRMHGSYDASVEKYENTLRYVQGKPIRRGSNTPSITSASDNFKRKAEHKGSISSQQQMLSVPLRSGNSKPGSGHRRRRSSSIASGSSGNSSGGGSQDSANRRRHKKAKQKDKKDNLLTRIRDVIAESDVFVEHHAQPVPITCIQIGLVSIIPFLVSLIWDTLAVTVFQVPHISMINYPGFMLVLQFVVVLFVMYGYCVQYVTAGSSSTYVTLSKISLVAQYVLFFWRVFMEMYFDGYRNQEKGYLSRTEDN